MNKEFCSDDLTIDAWFHQQNSNDIFEQQKTFLNNIIEKNLATLNIRINYKNCESNNWVNLKYELNKDIHGLSCNINNGNDLYLL